MDKEFDYWTHQDTPMDELKYPFSDELRCNCMDELKAAAFEYLLLNPGSEFGDWQQGLLSYYPAEVVDALGNNPTEVFADLADMWESDYEDPNTGICQKFSEWAMSFANEYAVGIYYYLVDACAPPPDVALMSKNRQGTYNNSFIAAAQASLED